MGVGHPSTKSFRVMDTSGHEKKAMALGSGLSQGRQMHVPQTWWEQRLASGSVTTRITLCYYIVTRWSVA